MAKVFKLGETREDRGQRIPIGRREFRPVATLKIGACMMYQEVGKAKFPPSLQNGVRIAQRATIQVPTIDPRIGLGSKRRVQAPRLPEQERAGVRR